MKKAESPLCLLCPVSLRHLSHQTEFNLVNPRPKPQQFDRELFSVFQSIPCIVVGCGSSLFESLLCGRRGHGHGHYGCMIMIWYFNEVGGRSPVVLTGGSYFFLEEFMTLFILSICVQNLYLIIIYLAMPLLILGSSYVPTLNIVEQKQNRDGQKLSKMHKICVGHCCWSQVWVHWGPPLLRSCVPCCLDNWCGHHC